MRMRVPIFTVMNPPVLPGFDGTDGTPVTLEEVKDLIKAAVPDVNKIVTTAMTNFKDKDLPKMFDDKINPMTTQLTGIQDILKTLAPAQAGAGTGAGAGAGAGAGSGGGAGKEIPPEVNAELASLRKTVNETGQQIKDLKEAKDLAEKEAERSDRHGKIKMGLSGLQFANDRAGETAFHIVEPFVQRLDDKSLVGVAQDGTHFPMETFFKDFITREHPYLLRGTGASGAGAAGGSGTGGRGMVADMSMIKPGMSAAERTAVLSAIATASNQR